MTRLLRKKVASCSIVDVQPGVYRPVQLVQWWWGLTSLLTFLYLHTLSNIPSAASPPWQAAGVDNTRWSNSARTWSWPAPGSATSTRSRSSTAGAPSSPTSPSSGSWGMSRFCHSGDWRVRRSWVFNRNISSVNSISTLADIQNCVALQELYIRKNCIPDISEVCYLRDLPRLKNLWLEENPCAEGDANLYRWTVLKNVPQLQKLDNVGVTSEEMAEAMRRGLELDHPLDGGSPNQSAQLRRQQHEASPGPPAPRGQRERSDSDQQYSQSRKESVQVEHWLTVHRFSNDSQKSTVSLNHFLSESFAASQ